MSGLIVTIIGCVVAYFLWSKLGKFDKYESLIGSVCFIVGFWGLDFIKWLCK